MSRLNRLLAHPFSWIVILSFSASVILMAAVDVSLALGFHSKENVGMTMFGALIIPFSVAGFATLSGWVVWRTEWVVRKDLWSAIKRFTIGFVVGPLIAYPFFALSISTIVIPLVLFFYVTSISSGLYTYAEYHKLEEGKRSVRERLGPKWFLDGEDVYSEAKEPIYFCESCLSLIPDLSECWRCGETFAGNLVRIDLSRQASWRNLSDNPTNSEPSD